MSQQIASLCERNVRRLFETQRRHRVHTESGERGIRYPGNYRGESWNDRESFLVPLIHEPEGTRVSGLVPQAELTAARALTKMARHSSSIFYRSLRSVVFSRIIL